jgi:hypothetical protein
MQDLSPDKDFPKQRSIELSNGNKINVTQTGPYGFWVVSYNKGQLPEEMRGHYTSYTQAEIAVNQYLQNKSK